MEQYNFYYDESEHSRKINLSTINAENYYDNFVAVIVGWKAKDEKLLFEKYIAFEEKYAYRKSKNELKSKTLKQSNLENGFASMNKNDVNLLNDFFAFFDENISIYFTVLSKIEFIISQIFEDYENSFLYDMDSMKYSIVKAILMYQPKEIVEGLFDNSGELVSILKTFFKERIDKNKDNILLKEKETNAFKEILMLLDDIKSIKIIDWDYNIAFYGFKQYLAERAINDFSLIIDKEGAGNTINAAKRVGFSMAVEVDSKESIGVRVSDMLAGVISKLLKALHHSLRYNSSDEQLKKKLLGKEWFLLNQEQLNLYKKLYIILCQLNNTWYKSFSGRYSDDLIVLIALLNYMNSFTSVEEINTNLDKQGNHFNSYVCEYLEDYYARLQNKLPIDIIPSDAKEYFFNQRGAKVFFDIQRQPMLKFINGMCRCHVLSIGFSKEGIPLATIKEIDGINCYRLPDDLGEWAMTAVGFANMGTNLFPADVVFTEYNGKFNADIL